MDLQAFFMENAEKTEQVTFVASKRFVKDGKPVPWIIRCITGEQDDAIRASCMRRVQVPGRKGQFTREIDANAYVCKLAVASTVYPNLNDQALQDSWGVMGAEALLKTMLNPGEYADYAAKVQEVCGFDASMDELVDEAKN